MATRAYSGAGHLIVGILLLSAFGWLAERLPSPQAISTFLSSLLLVVLMGGAGTVVVVVVRRLARRRRLLRKYCDEAIVAELMRGMLWEGETADQLQDSLGTPVDIDETVLKTKTKHVWKYRRTGKNRYRLRVKLDNGVVTGWDDKVDATPRR